MGKLIGRYIIAVLMIPIGVLLGIGGAVQNFLRRERYRRRALEIAAQVAKENTERHDSL